MEKIAVLYGKKFDETFNYLKKKKRILLVTTSNRWSREKDTPKSSQLAHILKNEIGNKVKIIDASKLIIHTCEGNVSTSQGNRCGLREALLKDKFRNPSGFHRCFASMNNKDDELWKISKELFESDCVVFFGSVRWGQANSIYQKLIERLTWIENRHSTLGEENIVKNIDAGIILVGQNWRGKEILEMQKKVLKFFGFNVANDLCWNWQYTNNENDESGKSYKDAAVNFRKTFIKR